MPIEDFFHEVAFNQMNAGRGQFAPQPPLWRRLTPGVRRALVALLVLGISGVAYVWREPILDFLRTDTAHAPGAADALTFSHHRSTEDQRLRRLAIACAREDDAGACMEALQKLLSLTDTTTVLAALQVPEVRALRRNEFFDRFALDIEQKRSKPPAPLTPDAKSGPVR